MTDATSIDRYRAMLQIVKHRLDDELEIQPQVMQRIATQVVIHNSRMLQAKEDLAQLEARLLLDYKDSDEKITVQMINAKIMRSPARISAWQKYQEARATHEDWVGLLDAWKGKGFALKTLSDLYQAQYFSVDYTGSNQKTRERIAQQGEYQRQERTSHMTTMTDSREGLRRSTEPENQSKPSRRTLT